MGCLCPPNGNVKDNCIACVGRGELSQGPQADAADLCPCFAAGTGGPGESEPDKSGNRAFDHKTDILPFRLSNEPERGPKRHKRGQSSANHAYHTDSKEDLSHFRKGVNLIAERIRDDECKNAHPSRYQRGGDACYSEGGNNACCFQRCLIGPACRRSADQETELSRNSSVVMIACSLFRIRL